MNTADMTIYVRLFVGRIHFFLLFLSFRDFWIFLNLLRRIVGLTIIISWLFGGLHRGKYITLDDSEPKEWWKNPTGERFTRLAKSVPQFLRCPTIPHSANTGNVDFWQAYGANYHNNFGGDRNYAAMQLTNPRLAKGYKTNSDTDANYVKDVSPSERLLMVDSVNWNKIQSSSTILWQNALGTSGATNFYGFAAPLHSGRMNLLTVGGSVASTDPSGLGNYFYARSVGGSTTNPQRLISVKVTGYCDPEVQGVPMTGTRSRSNKFRLSIPRRSVRVFDFAAMLNYIIYGLFQFNIR